MFLDFVAVAIVVSGLQFLACIYLASLMQRS